MKKIPLQLVFLFVFQMSFSQDLISDGSNKWIFHTPDDGRTTLWIAPWLNNDWQWGASTQFLNNGDVNFYRNISISGNVSSAGSISAYGNLSASDYVMQGSNSWILHSPDDGRTTLWIAPKVNNEWQWGASTQFLNNGDVNFNRNISILGNISSVGSISSLGNLSATDYVMQGANSWILHSPDDGRTTLFLAPKVNNEWQWGASTQFLNNGNVNFNGNVGIGTTNPTSKLTVAGNINSREVKVTVDAGADFVFENDYDLPSLITVENYIKENKHLPEIASAKEMQTNGINLSEMNIKLLQKVEELTLYVIEQNKSIEGLKEQLKEHKTKIEKFETATK